REEALQAAEEAVRTLSPFYLRHPAAFNSWMQIMVGNYRKRAEELGRKPDEELLQPIVERLAGG
ncbi:MAG TPA: hypothetical protein DD490_31035, partial [Acidobacteria bacterium]|nr:hypothetical protein [Acidobacteriota bacterium]